MNTINERDLAILDHVHRHRLASREILQQLFFPNASRNAVGKVIVRLTQHDWLREHRLANGFAYCTLGRRGARQLAAPARVVRPFTEQTLPAAYAFSAFCATRSISPLTAAEFQQEFPTLCPSQSVSTGYFRYSIAGQTHLAVALVDRANTLRHLFRKLDRLIRRRYQIPGFFALIHQRRFCITILTGWPAKQEDLAAALRKKSFDPTRVEAHVVPQLQLFYRRM